MMRAFVLPTSLAFAGGLVTGLFVASRRLGSSARARLQAAPGWSFAEADLVSNLFHLPGRAR